MSDHPRSRGVYGFWALPTATAAGSPPLARGLRRRYSAGVSRGWITPARAGFTTIRTAQKNYDRDHPRSRGVYAKNVWVARISVGSPPLARGLRARERIIECLRRITPARAGFTQYDNGRGFGGLDHPRSRGVYPDYPRDQKRKTGSPPLARGLRLMGTGKLSGVRITPARAGFTGGGEDPHRPPGDHPRSRGVYGGLAQGHCSREGSPPLARGLRPYLNARNMIRRITPARAGFTPGHPHDDETMPDHPRSRGVYSSRAPGAIAPSGSPPLARGLLCI